MLTAAAAQQHAAQHAERLACQQACKWVPTLPSNSMSMSAAAFSAPPASDGRWGFREASLCDKHTPRIQRVHRKLCRRTHGCHTTTAHHAQHKRHHRCHPGAHRCQRCATRGRSCRTQTSSCSQQCLHREGRVEGQDVVSHLTKHSCHTLSCPLAVLYEPA